MDLAFFAQGLDPDPGLCGSGNQRRKTNKGSISPAQGRHIFQSALFSHHQIENIKLIVVKKHNIR